MRTPLTAIQGSSELICRYALTEEKRKQMAQLINSESKRLARMIEIFLNVERLSAGQMELKHETIRGRRPDRRSASSASRPLAERKQIAHSPRADRRRTARLTGDRELMEYACYNLLTNAVKYSPQRTEVTVIRLARRRPRPDLGPGPGHRHGPEGSQARFSRSSTAPRRRRNRAKRAPESGCPSSSRLWRSTAATIEVTSQPGAGFLFYPGAAGAAQRDPAAAERH